MPWLFTSTCTGPKADRTAAAAASTASVRVTSHATASAVWPSARSASTAASAAGAFTSRTAVRTPARPSAIDTARPIPEAPPVTTAVRSSNVTGTMGRRCSRRAARRRCGGSGLTDGPRIQQAGGRMQLWPRRRWARVLLVVVAVLVVVGVLAWRNQSVLIGSAAEWYLSRVAEDENTSGKLDRRREILANVNRQLLMPPPSDALVPELFDLVTIVSSRVATGEISLNWVAYLYTTYQ